MVLLITIAGRANG